MSLRYFVIGFPLREFYPRDWTCDAVRLPGRGGINGLYTVLLVDDEELERKVVAFTLQNSGLPIEIVGEAANGREALEQVGRTWPDLIIMDIKMPGINGLEASRQIKALFPATQVIMLTAYGKFSYSQQAIKAQVDDYLLKPIQPQQLNKAVAEAISRLAQKRLQPGSGIDLAKISELVRLGNLEDAKREWAVLLESVAWDMDAHQEGLRAEAGTKENEYGDVEKNVAGVADGVRMSRAWGYSLGWRLLVIVGQVVLSGGAKATEVSALEQDMAVELARISGWDGLQQWGERLLENCLDIMTQTGFTPDKLVVRQAMEYIETHFCEDISLVKVSAHIHLSPTYFSRIFKKTVGLGFADFLANMRLKVAKQRLRNSTETIEQIAEALSFSSSSYFSSVFKKYEGVTPSEYRAKRNTRR